MSHFQIRKRGHILGVEVRIVPYALLLPKKLRNAGWKVKIFDKESREPPHITVMRGPNKWRIDLRSGEFMKLPGGTWSELDEGVQKAIDAHWHEFIRQWDALYPENPVASQEPD